MFTTVRGAKPRKVNAPFLLGNSMPGSAYCEIDVFLVGMHRYPGRKDVPSFW